MSIAIWQPCKDWQKRRFFFVRRHDDLLVELLDDLVHDREVILLVRRRVNANQRPEIISTFPRLHGVKLSHTLQRGLLEPRGATELTKVGTHDQGDLSEFLLGRDFEPGVGASLLTFLQDSNRSRLRSSYGIRSFSSKSSNSGGCGNCSRACQNTDLAMLWYMPRQFSWLPGGP